MAANPEETMSNVKDEYGVLFSEDRKELIKFPSDFPWKSYAITKGVTKIRKGAFRYCGLERITIPESVTEIEEDAFYGCDNLKKIISLNLTPPTVERGYLVGHDYNCVLWVRKGSRNAYLNAWGWGRSESFGIIELIGESSSNFVSDEYGVQYSKDGRRLLKCHDREIGKYTIRKGTEVICENAFEDCFGLKKVNIPKSVKKICYRAFKGCSALAKISIPNGVLEIEDYAFAECYSLAEIPLPNSVREIGEEAFSYCTALKKITISDGVEKIKEHTFLHCSNLEDVIIGKKNRAEISGGAFHECYFIKNFIVLNDEPPEVGISYDGRDFFCKDDMPDYTERWDGYIEEKHNYYYPHTEHCFLHIPLGAKGEYTSSYSSDIWKGFRSVKEMADSPEGLSMIDINDINQEIYAPVGSYVDKKGKPIILSTRIEGLNIENAIRNSFDVVMSLVGYGKLSISDSVFNVLLSRNKDDVDMIDKIKIIQFSDKITTVLSSAKIAEIKKKLSNSGVAINYLDFKFNGELCVIKRSDIYKCWIVNRNGDIIIDPCSRVVLLSEKTALCTYSKDSSVEKQIIVDFNGKVLASVDWGDVNVVSRDNDLIILARKCGGKAHFSVYSISKTELLFPFQPYKLDVKYGRIYIENKIGWRNSEPWYLYSKNCLESKQNPGTVDFCWKKYIWSEKKPWSYEGDVAEHIDYWFTNGPCFGYALLDAFKSQHKKVFEYLYSGFLQISNEAVKELISVCGKSKNVDALIYYRDMRFEFKDIMSSKDTIDACIYCYNSSGRRMELHPFYQGQSFQGVFCEDPQYIISYLRAHHWVMVSRDVLYDVPDSDYRQKLQKILDVCERRREKDEYEREHRYDDYYEEHDYEEDTYYALGGEDYRRFKESGGDISDMMEMMGF